MSDNETTTYQAYWSNVESIAEEIAAGLRDGTVADESYRIHEEIDGSWWLIYHHAARAVMQHTQHDDALIDEMGGEIGEVSSFDELVGKFAYFAMRADVADCLSRLDTSPADEDGDEDDRTVDVMHGVHTVADSAGGRWWPDEQTATEIAGSADPEAAALRISADQPGRGEWRS